MKKSYIIILVLILLGISGYFLVGKRREVPRNSPGVVNEEVENINYKLFSRSDYEKARVDKKVIMLYFTANWCPICREQEPINMQALKDLESDNNIVAFRIHILDSETTKENEALAKEFDVRYQHTTIIIANDGTVPTNYTGPLTKEDLKKRLLAAKKS